MKNWKLLDPDEGLNRIVRQAAFCGPQRVTLEEDIEVVVLGAAKYARLTGEPREGRRFADRNQVRVELVRGAPSSV